MRRSVRAVGSRLADTGSVGRVRAAVVGRVADRLRDAVHPSAPPGTARGGLDRLPVAAIEVDASDTVCDANQAARAVLVDDGGPLVGRPMTDVAAGDHLGEGFLRGYREAVEALASGDGSARSTFTAAGDGDERIYEAQYGGGAEEGIVATIRDVTEEHARREAQADRADELDLYEQAVEATTDGVAILSEDVEFLMVNSRFAESIGQTKEEIVGTTVSAEETEVIVEAPDDLTEQWVQAGEEAREQGRSTFFYESTVDLEKGRREIENRVTAVRQEDGSLIYVVTTRDITDRKTREAQIEDLHASTRTLMAADSEEQVAREVVEAVETTLGFPANVVRLVDAAGETLEPVAVTDRARELLGERSTIPTEDHPLGEAFRAGEALLLDDVREHTDAFDDCAVRSVLSLPIGQYGLLSIVDGEVGAYDEADVGIAEILASNAEAAFGRVEREGALRERERALSRQIDRLDRFAGIVSHDLRNPLNVAIGHLEFLEEQVDDLEHVEAIEGALERMEAITEDVLTLARKGDEATELEHVDLRATVEACWGTVDTADATLEAETDLRIRADESRLRQLLENLIRNGIDHVGDDVTIRVGPVDGGFYLEDDGPGIPAADREAVFEAGYSTGDGGTGFGLNIVRTIAEAHGWAVSITEGSDGGARFEFTGVDVLDGEDR